MIDILPSDMMILGGFAAVALAFTGILLFVKRWASKAGRV